MSTDVRSVTLTADGTVYAGRQRIRHITYVATATAGSIVLRDGGASGTIKLNVATPAVADAYDVVIPGNGILFDTDVYLDLTNVTSVTFFYG
jgi:N-acyl-D-aspartate/D-glutamate deacylase